MSDVVNEAAFIGSDHTMAQIIAPRTQGEARDEKLKEKETVRAALIPAAEILTKVIDEEIETNTNLSTYSSLVNTANPDGNQIHQEFRARELYSAKLKNLKRLIERATKGVESE